MEVRSRVVRTGVSEGFRKAFGNEAVLNPKEAVLEQNMRGAFAVCAHNFGTMGSLENYDYDLVTIGAGSGGTRASRISAQHYGAKVACVELPFGFLSSDDIGGAGGT